MAQLGRGLKWCRKRFLESQFIDQVGGRERFQVFESGLQSALNLAQLRDDQLSAPKPQKPCKAHGFLTLCMLQGNPPRLPNMLEGGFTGFSVVLFSWCLLMLGAAFSLSAASVPLFEVQISRGDTGSASQTLNDALSLYRELNQKARVIVAARRGRPVGTFRCPVPRLAKPRCC